MPPFVFCNVCSVAVRWRGQHSWDNHANEKRHRKCAAAFHVPNTPAVTAFRKQLKLIAPQLMPLFEAAAQSLVKPTNKHNTCCTAVNHQLCDQGHELEFCRDPYGNGLDSCWCDKCNARLSASYHCAECQFDLCRRCAGDDVFSCEKKHQLIFYRYPYGEQQGKETVCNDCGEETPFVYHCKECFYSRCRSCANPQKDDGEDNRGCDPSDDDSVDDDDDDDDHDDAEAVQRSIEEVEDAIERLQRTLGPIDPWTALVVECRQRVEANQRKFWFNGAYCPILPACRAIEKAYHRFQQKVNLSSILLAHLTSPRKKDVVIALPKLMGDSESYETCSYMWKVLEGLPQCQPLRLCEIALALGRFEEAVDILSSDRSISLRNISSSVTFKSLPLHGKDVMLKYAYDGVAGLNMREGDHLNGKLIIKLARLVAICEGLAASDTTVFKRVFFKEARGGTSYYDDDDYDDHEAPPRQVFDLAFKYPLADELVKHALSIFSWHIFPSRKVSRSFEPPTFEDFFYSSYTANEDVDMKARHSAFAAMAGSNPAQKHPLQVGQVASCLIEFLSPSVLRVAACTCKAWLHACVPTDANTQLPILQHVQQLLTPDWARHVQQSDVLLSILHREERSPTQSNDPLYIYVERYDCRMETVVVALKVAAPPSPLPRWIPDAFLKISSDDGGYTDWTKGLRVQLDALVPALAMNPQWLLKVLYLMDQLQWTFEDAAPFIQGLQDTFKPFLSLYESSTDVDVSKVLGDACRKVGPIDPYGIGHNCGQCLAVVGWRVLKAQYRTNGGNICDEDSNPFHSLLETLNASEESEEGEEEEESKDGVQTIQLS